MAGPGNLPSNYREWVDRQSRVIDVPYGKWFTTALKQNVKRVTSQASAAKPVAKRTVAPAKTVKRAVAKKKR